MPLPAPKLPSKVKSRKAKEPVISDPDKSSPVANELLWLLAELSGELCAATDLMSLQQILSRRLRWLLDFDRCTLSIVEILEDDTAAVPRIYLMELGLSVDPATQSRSELKSSDLTPTTWPGMVISEAKPFYLSDLSQLPEGLHLPADPELGMCENARSLLLLPLKFGSKSLGSLNFSSRRTNTFTTVWRNITNVLAMQVSGQLASILANQSTARAMVVLQSERDLARQIMQNMGQGLFISNRAGQIEFANEAYGRLVGYSPDQLIGRKPQELALDQTSKVMSEAHNQCLQGAKSVYEYSLRKANGQVAFIKVIEVPHFQAGQINGTISVTTDLTEFYETVNTQRRYSEYLAALHETALALLNQPELSSVLEAILTRAASLSGTPDCYIYQLKPGSSEPQMELVMGLGIFKSLIGLTLNQQQGLVGQVWQTGQPVIIHDYPNWPHRLEGTFYDQIGTTVGLPLKVGDRLAGILGLSFPQGDVPFEKQQLDILGRFAHLTALALENVRLYAAAQRRLTELTTLQQVAQVINSTLKLEEIFQLVVNQISSAFGFKLVSIYLREEKGLLLQASVGYDEVISFIPLNLGISSEVIRSGQAQFIREAQRNPNFLFAIDGIRQSIIVPLKTGNGQILGTVAVESRGEPLLTEDDFTLLSLLADQVSVAVENVQLFAELGKSEEKYREVISNVKEIIGQVDSNGNWTFLNPAWEELLGYEVNNTLGRPMLDFVEASDWPVFNQNFNLIQSGAVNDCDFEAQWRSRDGSLKWFQVYGKRAITGKGQQSRLIITLMDITTRKQAELEILRVQKLESLSLLAGGIAHDFNNILTSVVGNLELAKRETNEQSALFRPQLYEMLAEAESAAFRARDLTRQLLTFARGGMPVRKVISLNDLLVETTRFALRGSKVRSKVEVAGDLWPCEVDEGQLSQVLNNLVINALQAMPNGGEITVQASNLEAKFAKRALTLKETDYVELVVSDQGTGIDPANLDRIFDPYFTTKAKGSGLGLATSFSIIRKHEGLIRVQSEPGKGTSFFIYLPASPSKLPMLAEKTTGKFTPKSNSTGKKILVMDDEKNILTMVKRVLTMLGYQVDLVEDGKMAIEKYQAALLNTAGERPYDLVIMDLTIPGGMGGKETIEQLHQLDPNVKAIVASGYSNDSILANYREHGFLAALSKPFRLNELSLKVQQVLET